MNGKRIVSILIILSLVLSSITMVYGLEEDPQQVVQPTEDAIDVPTDGAISGGGITDGALDEEIVDPQTEPQPPVLQNDSTPQSTANLMAVPKSPYYLQKMGTDGKLTKEAGFTTLKDANTAMKAKTSSKNAYAVTNGSNKILNINSGMAYFKSSDSTVTIGNTYITPKDALHFYSGDGSNATVGISGAKASVAVSKLTLIPGILVNRTGYYKKDYYYKSTTGDLFHYVYRIKSPTLSNSGSSTILAAYTKDKGCTAAGSVHVVDKAPSWMKTATNYYSVDGINYYTDTTLGSKAGTHYIYYKYLPYRSTTSYTDAQLNKWIASKTTTGKLPNQGKSFINAQNSYGINAVTELAFACLESNYGKSSFAVNRNNLFGINAVDSNPGKANTFSSVASCINEHTSKYMSRGYGDAKTDGRYYGLTAGNKAVGVNVQYASDPWHGEQIAGIAYYIDKYLGSKDYGKYTIGVTNKKSVSVYKKAGSTYLYNLSTKSAGNGPQGIPVIILGTSGSYYLIQSDMPISGNTAHFSYIYNFANSKAYVKQSDITKASSGKVKDSIPSGTKPAAQTNTTPKTDTKTVVKKTATPLKFGIYNSKTKMWNKSKKGKRTTLKRKMFISAYVKTNSKRTTVQMRIYNKDKKLVARKVQYIKKTKWVNFSWNGTYTSHNKLKKKAGKYAPYSKKGTKYYVRFSASRSGTKTHYGKYHAFYLYK